YSNSIAGIDLSATVIDGVDVNDAGDVDTGTNNFQNWAVLQSVAIANDGTFDYLIDTTTVAAGSYTIDFYASTELDGGVVEGKRLLGSVSGVLNGNNSLSGSLSGITLASGEYVTLVTTDSSGNSSEFSNYAVATDSDAGGATPSDAVLVATSGGGLSINEDGGNDTYLVADDSSALMGGLSAFTFEHQFSTTETGAQAFVSYTRAGNDDEFKLVAQSNGDLIVSVGGQSLTLTAFDFQTLVDGTKHAVAFSWDNTSGAWALYVDGAEVDSGTGLATGQTLASGGALVIGNEQDAAEAEFNSSTAHHATLFDTRLFNDVRTAEEISASYRSSLPYDEASLIANWRFDAISTNGVVTDTVSGNNLTVRHINEPGFTASDASLTLSVDENAIDGTVVGFINGADAERDARIASLLAADPDLVYSAETGKFYKLVQADITWASANTSALATTLSGISGQLGTIRSAAEQELFTSFRSTLNDPIWLGGRDSTIEGVWKWQEGGADADQFWNGTAAGFATDGSYTHWFNNSEPGGGATEDNLVLWDGATGGWADAGDSMTASYVVEWNADTVLDVTDAITYSITSQTVAGAFAVDADSGKISVADGSLLDFETNATHTLTIRTTDVDGNTYDRAVSISLADLAESNLAPTNLSSGIELNTDGGNDAYLVTTDAQSILGGLTQFTLETTFSLADADFQVLFSYNTATTDNVLLATVESNGSLKLSVNNSAVYFSAIDYTQLLADGEVHHLAFTWENSAGSIAVYLDGELSESVSGKSVGASLLSEANSAIVIGQEQDSVNGGFSSLQTFRGTLYDVRIWNDVRTEPEIALNYQQKFDAGSPPSGLVANWQMDGFNGSNEVVDIVSGNNLGVAHASGIGFSSSTPVQDLHISEHAAGGTSVGYVMPNSTDVSNDIVNDGQFNQATDPGSWQNYSAGQSIGAWTVSHNNVDLIGTYMTPPDGSNFSIQLNGSSGVQNGGIEQTLTTVAGQQYQVIFETTGDWTLDTDPQKFRVSADGAAEDIVVEYDNDWSVTNPLWQQRSMTFTATDASTVLNFSSLEGNDYDGPLVANIR
ncbi:MAG: DUF642 domain-containing protein, partial [Planctomycetales bacterium]|nr:DUF642 domain-containing protein [Planctomycetales bacterium]